MLLAGCAAYAAISSLLYWPLFAGDPSRIYGGAGGDPAQTVWFFAWAAHWLSSAGNPFLTHSLNAPFGINLAQATAVPLLAVAAAPLTLVAGPFASANLLMVSAMPLSAASAFVVFRRWSVATPAAWVGGLLYGFCPFALLHAQFHLQLAFLVFPPLIVYRVVAITQSARPRIRYCLATALLVAAQFLVSEEILAMTLIGLASGYGAAALRALFRRGRAPALRAWRRGAAHLLLTALAAGILLAYPVWFQLRGPEHYTGAVWGVKNAYNADLLTFLVPSPTQWLHFGLSGLSLRLTTLAGGESGVFLGLPFIVAVVVALAYSRRDRRSQLAFVAGFVALVCSLGRTLQIDGHHTSIALPLMLLDRIPGMADILPVRFVWAVLAAWTAVIVFGLDRVCRRKPRAGRTNIVHAAAAGALVLAVVVSWTPKWPLLSGPAGVAPTTAALGLAKANDPVALTYPYPIFPYEQGMLWQASDGLRYRLLGGYGPMVGADGSHSSIPPLLNPPALQEFLASEQMSGASPYPPPPATHGALLAQTRELLDRYDVHLIIVGLAIPNASKVINLMAQATGAAPRRVNGFAVWSLSPS